MNPPTTKAAFRLTATLSLFLAVLAAGCTATPSASKNPATGSTTITLVNMQFDPPELTVKTGSTVEWVNQDHMSHDVTAKDKAWQSTGGPGGLSKGDAFSKAFDTPGVYEYYCALHGNSMAGKIIVQ